MTIQETITLEAPSASGKKFYAVDIVEHRRIPGRPADYTVDFRHGAVGGTVKTGTKTKQPVGLITAKRIFDDQVREKMNGPSRYVVAGKAAPEVEAAHLTSPPELKCLPCRLLNDIEPDRILPLIDDDDWWVQLKYDGDRVQLHLDAGKVTLFSGRSGKLRACPKPIADALRHSPHSFVLDGELVGETLWVFDILTATYRLAGAPAEVHDYGAMPYEYRHKHLSRLIATIGSPSIWRASTAIRKREKEEFILAARDSHQEGVVFVNKNAPLQPGRPSKGGNSLRWKFTATAFVIVYAQNVKRSITMRLADGDIIGTCTIPPNREMPPVGSVVEVEYLYAQDSLVQAVYKGVRSDVEPAACTRAQLKFKDGKDPKNA